MLGDEREGSILEYSDYHWKKVACLLLCRSIELLTESHDVYTSLTECRTNWWRWIRLTSFDLEFENLFNFLSHNLL